MSTTRHVPVMLREVLHELALSPGLTVLDGTVGAGGHSQAIQQRIQPTGLLIGFDRDDSMLARAQQRINSHHAILIHSSYSTAKEKLHGKGVEAVDRILLDLGLSSDQLADAQRGFGYGVSGPLDMRFDSSSGEPASSLLANWDERDLETVFREYGEERFSREIAAEIVRRRDRQPIETTHDLMEAVESAIPLRFRQEARKEPATRVFQALRIAVNRELSHLENALVDDLYELLRPGGRIVIITFHSLEDRIVKNSLRNEERWDPLTRKPIAPSTMETRMNPRSRSAKLRVAVKK